jgi:hypothetical protein
LFNSGHQAVKELKLQKGQEINLWFHKNYTLDDLPELTCKYGLEHIKVRHDSGGISIIEGNRPYFGHDLSELGICRIFKNENEAKKSWLFLLDGIRRQFKKIMKAQGFKSRKKHPESYV